MNIIRRTRWLLGALLLTLPLWGGVVAYTDYNSWSAIRTPDAGVIDFNSTSVSGVPSVVLSGFTFQAWNDGTGAPSSTLYSLSSAFAGQGIALQSPATRTLQILPGANVYALGLIIALNGGGSGDLSLTVNGTPLTIQPPFALTSAGSQVSPFAFIGVQSDTPISTFYINSLGLGGNYFVIDNVRWSTQSSPGGGGGGSTETPEIATYWMISSAVGALYWLRRRRMPVVQS
jgi:hypothetical protein